MRFYSLFLQNLSSNLTSLSMCSFGAFVPKDSNSHCAQHAVNYLATSTPSIIGDVTDF
jgi:hypothetical protein